MEEVTELHHHIDSRRVAGRSGRYGDIRNPATGEVIARCPYASAEEVDDAVRAASEAFGKWKGVSLARRSAILFRFRELVIEHTDRIGELLGREHGKTLADGRAEVARALEVIDFACGIPHLLKGEYSANVSGGIDVHSVREPMGVIAGITAFNFPIMLPVWLGAVAVACGNTFINKPSERDPSVPLYLSELWSEAGLPAGVWNVVNGDKSAVDALLEHPLVPAINFIGSTKVGEYVYQSGTRNNKRVQAFCSAKNHAVILPDADPDEIAGALLSSGFGASGQRCMAVSVAVPVGEAMADAVVERLLPRVKGLKLGAYDDPDAELCPLISSDARERVSRLVGEGVAAGAALLADGREAPPPDGYEGGNFIGGSLFDRVEPDMSIYREEIFGPVLSVVRAGDVEEAIRLVNANEYGNGVAVYTRNGAAARSFSESVDVGMIGVNVAIPVPVAYFSFGGLKRSKFGDTYINGPEAIRFVTKMKMISSRWGNDRQSTALSMPTHS